MPALKYALDPGGPKRLQISWKGMWKDVVVRLDDQEIGHIPDRAALKEGRSFALPDGSQLSVALRTQALNQGLEVLRDGQALPGSAADPQQQLKLAAGIVYFVGGLSLLLGILAAVAKVDFLINLGFGAVSMGVGVLFVVLGYFVSQRSMIALGVAMALFAADFVLSIMAAIDYGGRVPTGGIVIRIFLLFGMWSGFGAIKKLRQAEQSAPPAATQS